MNEKRTDKTDGVCLQQLPPTSVMSGQLPGVNVTSVHLMVLASSIPASHLSPPPAALRLRSGQSFASSVCPQGTAGHSWQVAQPGFKAALFRLNCTIQPTTDGILCFCSSSTLTPPHCGSLSLPAPFRQGPPGSIASIKTATGIHWRQSLKKKMHPTKSDQYF